MNTACLNCGKAVRPHETKEGLAQSFHLARNDKEHFFCSLRCGFDFGLAMARAGYRKPQGGGK